MAVIRLTKEFSFEAAHALDGYDGPCREIHGHSYRLFVTVKGTPAEDASNPKCGMVLDFGDLKHALRELGIAEDAEEFKVGMDYSYPYQIAGIYRDFQIGSALDKPQSAMLWQTNDIADMYPWNILVKIRGDKTVAYNTVKSVFERISDGAVFTGAEYIEQEIEADYADQRRILHIVGIFTLVAILISALGLVAMSTYYIQQKEQEVAVRKVFGSTRGEVLTRLVGNFMRLVGTAFVIAVPVAWYLLERWLQDYSVRISLSPLIFLASGAFATVVAFVAVFWQSSRASDSNPIDSIKN